MSYEYEGVTYETLHEMMVAWTHDWIVECGPTSPEETYEAWSYDPMGMGYRIVESVNNGEFSLPDGIDGLTEGQADGLLAKWASEFEQEGE